MTTPSNKLNILFVSTSFPKDTHDWRGRFIYNIADALSRLSQVDISLWAPGGLLPSNTRSVVNTKDAQWLLNMSELGGIAHNLRKGLLSGLRMGLGLIWRLHHVYHQSSNIQIAHVNWLQNAIPLYGTKIPLVVSVLGSDMKLLKLPGVTFILRRTLQQRAAIISPNAQWMIPLLQKKFGDVATIEHVPFGVDPAWFEINRSPENPVIWLAVTRITQKKLGSLFEWGEGIFNAKRQLHLFGPMQESLPLPPWVYYHGPTHPHELSLQWFPRASGLISLSTHDEGLPQVMLEAMASTLPIVASDISAHRDIVEHGVTGWLAKTKSDLASGLEWAEQPDINHSIGALARSRIKSRFGTWDDCALRYLQLYKNVLAH